VVGRKPIHLLREEERKKVPELRELHIDVGARDKAQAEELVRVGDVAVIDSGVIELPNRRVVSRALDNRLGAFVALQVARLVAEGGPAAGDVIAVANAQEEVTLGGAQTSAYALRPDMAVVVDVTHATDAPGVDVKEYGRHDLGSGPTLTRGATLHPRVFELLAAAAEGESIAYTVEASGRATGTDADAVQLSRAGVPTGLVSIPLRYMHSPVELVALDDVEAAAQLIAALALALKPGVEFAR
jgi:endoglucanase